MAIKPQHETAAKIRILFMGTPEFACPTLQVLLQHPEAYEVVGVVTQPDRPAGRNMDLQRSKVRNLAEGHLQTLGKIAKKFPILTPENINTQETIEVLEKLAIDVAVVVAYGQILGSDVLKTFRVGAVNVHASLLPRWRGAAPIAWSILAQDAVTGVTLQKIVQKLDAGDIIGTSQVVLDDSWDAPKLYNELSHRGADLVRRLLPEFVAGKIKLTPQDESQACYAAKIKKEQGLINWNQSAREIFAQIRALTPWPGTWTTRDGKILKIMRATYVDHVGGEPGDLVGMDKINIWVQCGGNTALQISVVQPESRSRMPVAEYSKGYPFKKGDKLGT